MSFFYLVQTLLCFVTHIKACGFDAFSTNNVLKCVVFYSKYIPDSIDFEPDYDYSH